MSGQGAFDLQGRVALVTGGSRGLGHGMALALARAGADVAVTSRTLRSLDDVAEQIAALGRRALPRELDVCDERSIRTAVASVVEELGRVDILVNNAGCIVRKEPLDLTWEDWNVVLDTNLRGSFFVAQAVAPSMIESGRGRIVNIGSVTTAFGAGGLVPYGASRGGIKQLTMSLADAWAQYGITVNCIAPGWFHTAQTDVLFQSEAWVETVTSRIPLRRTGLPSDLDGAVVFLASDASAYITGQTLFVDGGATTGAFPRPPAPAA
jgi:NAD(P)-dependent dehydrogenase (short-subunit alcohol dehydrogenase family)